VTPAAVAAAPRIAALPMYDFPEAAAATDALWAALAAQLRAAGVRDVPAGLTRDLGQADTWRHPRLLLGQACEYPLAKSYASYVRVLATPRYTAPGCAGALYRSAIVVRADDPATTLVGLRERRCVINELDSNSGMNLLRAAIAPLANGRPFFASVALSGAHRNSVRLVAEGRADVAAIDCVSFAHIGRAAPGLTARLRILAWTPATPCLPLVTARTSDGVPLPILRAALAAVSRDPALAAVRERLFLGGFDLDPDDSFAAVLRLEREAAELGYPVLQ